MQMQDVLPGDSRAAEPRAVCVICDLQHAASYVSRTGLKKVFDVVAIDRNPPIPAEVEGDRPGCPKLAESNGAQGRWPGSSDTRVQSVEPSISKPALRSL